MLSSQIYRYPYQNCTVLSVFILLSIVWSDTEIYNLKTLFLIKTRHTHIRYTTLLTYSHAVSQLLIDHFSIMLNENTLDIVNYASQKPAINDYCM